MKAVLDTQFFMTSLESEDDEFRKWARRTLETVQREPNRGIIPSIVMHEFYKLQIGEWGRAVAETRLNAVLKLNLKIINLDLAIAIAAAKLRCKYAKLPTADAIIAATAVVTSSECVLTDDKHISQIKETKTKWI